jgi:hypothetical protein
MSQMDVGRTKQMTELELEAKRLPRYWNAETRSWRPAGIRCECGTKIRIPDPGDEVVLSEERCPKCRRRYSVRRLPTGRVQARDGVWDWDRDMPKEQE